MSFAPVVGFVGKENDGQLVDIQELGVNALVHAIEINDRHGVGVYLRRLFGTGDDFVLFRSRTLYAGENAFGSHEEFLGDRFATMSELRGRIAGCAAARPIERVLCVPYYPEDFRHAVMLKEATGARLCTYLMDDQNIVSREVGDGTVRRLLEASDLRLGISPQMCMAYERKFALPVAWMPPVLPALRETISDPVAERRAALIGNVWSALQLSNLRRVAKESGWTIDWFGRGPDASWLNATPADLASDGIRLQGFLDDDTLAARLAEYPFALVPTGTADDADDIRSFSLLSLPSRVVHLLTQTGLPLLVLGSGQSAVAAFVQEMGCGEVAAYDAMKYQAAAERICGDRETYRDAVREAARKLVLPDAGEWIWRSLERGAPADDRFESMRNGRLARLEFEPTPERRFPPRRNRGWLSRRFGGFADLEEVRFSRKSQLRKIRRRAPLEATGSHSFEVSLYQRALATALVREHVRPGGLIGILDGDPTWLRPVHATHSVEQVDVSTRDCDAVVSFNRESTISKADLDAMTGGGGLQVHCWTAYQRPEHFHATPAAMHLLDEIDDLSRVSDEILSVDDFLFMSMKAIERFWKPADMAAAGAAGRPFSLNLCWRSPSTR